MARAAAPIAGSQMVRSLALGSDLVILALLVDREALGHYSASYRFFMVLLSLGTAYFVILLPRISERARSAGDEMAVEHRRSLWRLIPAAAAGALVLGLIAEPLLTLLFDPSFVAAAPALRLLAAAFVANLVGRHYRQILLARHRQDLDFRWTVVAVGVHLGAKWLFGITWGITGAAAGTLLGELVLAAGLRASALPHLRAAPTAESGL